MYPASEAPFLKRVKSQKERLRRRLDSNGDIQDIMNQLEMPDLEDQFRGIRVDNTCLCATTVQLNAAPELPPSSRKVLSPFILCMTSCTHVYIGASNAFASQRPHLRRRSRAKSRRRPASLFGSAPTRESRDTVSDDLEKDYSHDLAWGKGLFRAQDKVELDRVGNLHDTPRSWIVVANVGAHSAAHVDSYGYCTYLSFQKGRAIIWFLTFKWIVPKCCQIMPQPGKSVGTSQRDHRRKSQVHFDTFENIDNVVQCRRDIGSSAKNSTLPSHSGPSLVMKEQRSHIVQWFAFGRSWERLHQKLCPRQTPKVSRRTAPQCARLCANACYQRRGSLCGTLRTRSVLLRRL
ncbi:hypothetical protein IWX50DRAFT_614998 [Phyllosticta citricarpa]